MDRHRTLEEVMELFETYCRVSFIRVIEGDLYLCNPNSDYVGKRRFNATITLLKDPPDRRHHVNAAIHEVIHSADLNHYDGFSDDKRAEMKEQRGEIVAELGRVFLMRKLNVEECDIEGVTPLYVDMMLRYPEQQKSAIKEAKRRANRVYYTMMAYTYTKDLRKGPFRFCLWKMKHKE